ncbi:SDR family NAD(P)-dependent oxidoreductase [Sphingomonas oligophenolica]|uniref:SDR family oxidoreductase n=1 Tax=Sphingomonas oligophenolica TaxID=301154 RepID=A0ABU9YA26_9SPHN
MAKQDIPGGDPTPPRLAGRVAIVAGAGGAIGRGIALRLCREGASVAIVDADPEAAQQASEMIRETGGSAWAAGDSPSDRTTADVAVERVLSRFGQIDILVAAADYRTHWQPIADKSAASFAEAMRSFNEALFLMQAVYPVMRQAGGGSIIALGTTYGHFTQPYIADYIAAKEAIKAMVRSAAQEWGPFNIRVNLLEAAADTKEFQLYRTRRGAEEIDAALAMVPIPYRGDVVRDIGGAALFLASDDSRYITGEIIRADGGEHLATPVFEPDLTLAELI